MIYSHDRILRWLRDHELLVCGDCHRIAYRKDVTSHLTLVGTWVNLCAACRAHWFGGKPWEMK